MLTGLALFSCDPEDDEKSSDKITTVKGFIDRLATDGVTLPKTANYDEDEVLDAIYRAMGKLQGDLDSGLIQEISDLYSLIDAEMLEVASDHTKVTISAPAMQLLTGDKSATAKDIPLEKATQGLELKAAKDNKLTDASSNVVAKETQITDGNKYTVTADTTVKEIVAMFKVTQTAGAAGDYDLSIDRDWDTDTTSADVWDTRKDSDSPVPDGKGIQLEFSDRKTGEDMTVTVTGKMTNAQAVAFVKDALGNLSVSGNSAVTAVTAGTTFNESVLKAIGDITGTYPTDTKGTSLTYEVGPISVGSSGDLTVKITKGSANDTAKISITIVKSTP